MNYFISDLHLGHTHVIDMDKRPFTDTDNMCEEIIKRWNKKVTTKDDVYILGDFAWKPTILMDVAPQLKGRIHLIRGNHDKLNLLAEQFVTDVTEIRYLHLPNDTTVVLSHFPIASYRGMRHGGYHFYGHVHSTAEYIAFLRYKAICRKEGIPIQAYNVGCMLPYMDYTPQPFEYIIEAAEAYEKSILGDKNEFALEGKNEKEA